MKPDDLNDLKDRIEEALAASAEEFGSDAPAPDAPVEYVLPLEGTASHLVNVESTRAALTDHAVKVLGGQSFTVELEEGKVTREGRITITGTAQRGRAAAPKAAWTSENGEGNGECFFDPVVERAITTTHTGATGVQMPDHEAKAAAPVANHYDEDEANGGEKPE